MSDHSITSLIEKLEGLSKGRDELSAHVIKTLLAPDDAWVEQSKFNGAWCIYERREKPRLWGESNPLRSAPVTTSLDAALALAERRCPRFSVTVVKYRTNDGEFKPSGEASLLNPYGNITEHRGKAATPALALCAAVLRAQSEAR